MRPVVVVGLVVIVVVAGVVGFVTTVPEAGTTPLIGTGMGVVMTGIGVAVMVFRFRNRLKRPVRAGWLTTV
jgi:hypothetical protein